MKRSWLNWKTLAVIAVGVVVVGPILRQAIHLPRLPSLGGGQHVATPAPETSQAGGATATGGGRSRTTTVTADGRLIPTVGQPTILLNPGLVRPGTKVAVTGFGFDQGGVIDIVLKKNASDAGVPVSLAKADENGAFSASFTVPESLASRSPTVAAEERNSKKVALAQAQLPAGMAAVKLSKMVGKPGDVITLSASGFEPEEDIKVYWGQLNGDPAATLHADGGGNVGQAAVHIPVGAIGNTSLVLIGSKSQSVAIGQFIMLGLYPTVTAHPYAVKAGNKITLSAKGFGPDETVLIYVNGVKGPPMATVQVDDKGGFAGLSFEVPFGLKKQQSLILIGQQSRAVVNSGFLVLPYTPSMLPSTWGGFPGTTLSFYAQGFAAHEVVLVYKNHTLNGGGQLVSAFRVDDRGRAAAAGQYMIPSEDQGKVVFTAIGRESDGVATATVTVQHSEVAVQIPPQPKYTLPPDLQPATPTPVAPAAPHAGAGPAGAAGPTGAAGHTPPAGGAGQAAPAGGAGQNAPAGTQPAPAQTQQGPATTPGGGQGAPAPTSGSRGGGGVINRVQQLWQGIASSL